jgi:hypothetical protein
MRKNLLTALFILTGFHLSAQESSLKKGNLKLNAGLGIGSFVKVTGGKTVFPPLSVSVEYAIDNEMTIGAILGYTSTEDVDTYGSIGVQDVYRYSHILFGARANYYFNSEEKYDFYGGAFLGYNAISVSLTSSSSSGSMSSYEAEASNFLYGIHIGGRYKFSPKTSAFAEIGYGLALLNLGITINLK